MTQGNGRGQLEQQVVERAARDPQFRKDFMTNPRETAERELGVTIPEGIDITVVEETPSSVYVVLPALPPQVGEEMSDRELEAVAGGWTGFTENDFCNTKACRATGVPC